MARGSLGLVYGTSRWWIMASSLRRPGVYDKIGLQERWHLLGADDNLEWLVLFYVPDLRAF